MFLANNKRLLHEQARPILMHVAEGGSYEELVDLRLEDNQWRLQEFFSGVSFKSIHSINSKIYSNNIHYLFSVN